MAANQWGIVPAFKVQILTGGHYLGAGTTRATGAVDTFKGALYTAGSSMTPLGYTTYAGSTASEVTGTGYTAGGATVTNATAPLLYSSTATWTPSASLVWSSVTISNFDTLGIYNSTQSGNGVALIWLGGAQTVISGTFTVSMPTPGATTSLIQIA